MLEKLQKEQKEKLEILKEKYNKWKEKKYQQMIDVQVFQNKFQNLKKKQLVKVVNIIK